MLAKRKGLVVRPQTAPLLLLRDRRCNLVAFRWPDSQVVPQPRGPLAHLRVEMVHGAPLLCVGETNDSAELATLDLLNPLQDFRADVTVLLSHFPPCEHARRHVFSWASSAKRCTNASDSALPCCQAVSSSCKLTSDGTSAPISSRKLSVLSGRSSLSRASNNFCVGHGQVTAPSDVGPWTMSNWLRPASVESRAKSCPRATA
jgi:hypothetical protein